MRTLSEKRGLAVLLVLALGLFTVLPGTAVTAEAAAKTTVKTLTVKDGKKNVTKKTVSMKIGDKKTFTVTTKPKAAAKTAVYKSSKSAVAAVNKKGTVTAKKAGTARIQITVSSKKYKKKTTWVQVKVSAAENSNSNSNTTPGKTNTDQGGNTSGNTATQGSGSQNGNNTTPSNNTGTGKTLIVYMTEHENTGVDAATSASVVQLNGSYLGNTEAAAHIIQNLTGGDLFSVAVANPYPSDYSSLIQAARAEMNPHTEPALKNTSVMDLDQYDTVYIGYPIWWGDMPMAMYTFLKANDLSGKTIYLYSTSVSSGFSGTQSTIAGLQPGAAVSSSRLTLYDSQIEDGNLERLVTDWVNGHR